jgi:anthranilate phosphoribosyltransferase
MNIKSAISAVVDGRNLTSSEAGLIMREIMNGNATEAQIGSFLTALRMKGETVEEIVAFAKTMRDYCIKIHPKISEVLVDTCGTGGDKIKTFNASTLTAIIAAGANVKIAKHGNRAVTSQCGSADLLEGYGVNIFASPEIVEKCIEDVGIGFMFAPIFHPAMKNVANPRREIGIKSVFNILGPLTNPASAKAQLLGVYDSKLTEKLAQVIMQLGVTRAFVVHGLIGVDEVSIIGKTKVTELKDGSLNTYEIAPRQFGMTEASKVESIYGGDLQHSLKIGFQVLNGVEGPRTDMAILNAALCLVLGGRVKTIAEGVEVAKESIESGAALRKLHLLVKKSGGSPAKLEELESEFSRANS